MRKLLLLVAMGTIPARAEGQHVRHARLVARVDSIARQALKDGPTPGISIAVARGKDLMLAKGYGYARLLDSTPAGPETVYPIASITKQFTAAAILQLVEDDRLRLKDELTRHLPEYQTRQRITIEQLLSHTSGIPDRTAPDHTGRRHFALDLTPQEFLVEFANRSQDFAPGEKFIYSNAGYYLLGLVIEKVSGKPFADYVQERLLGPAAMGHSTYCGPDRPDRARGYEPVDSLIAPATPVGDEELFAAAGLCSTVGDLVKWERALSGGRIVNGFSWKQMIEPTELKDGSLVSYGYGLTLGKLGKHRSVGHGGSVRGFSSQVTYYPDDDVTVAVLANSERALTRRIADQIAGMVLGVVEPKIKDVAQTAAELDVYVGTYDLAGDPLEVFVEASRLMMRIGEAEGLRLLYQGSHEFVTEPDPATRLYFRLSKGRAKSLVFSAGQLTLNAARKPE